MGHRLLIDSLYYGPHGCACCSNVHHAHKAGFFNEASVKFNTDVLAEFLRNIYHGFDTSNEVEPAMWREILRIINEATVEGLSKAQTPPTHDKLFYESLRHSNEVFAAFKVHTMGVDMAAKLFDANGKLKPFKQWVNDVSSISSHQVGSWLQTEYDTAVIRAHQAADWREFERNKDVMPNLRWMPTTSPDPETTHQLFWQKKLNLPVDDPFWTKHHPGDPWNCKCSLEANNDAVVRPDDTGADKPQPGLDNNPGKDGQTFSDNHPYFPDGCSSCPFNKGFKNRIKTVFSNANNKKHCFNCSKIDNALSDAQKKLKGMDDVTPPHLEEYTVSGLNKDVFISPWHGENEVEENEKLAKFLAKKLGKKIYLLPRLEQNNKKQAALRKTLLPPGVKEGKNPDYLIGGILFDGKSMMNIEPITGVKAQKKNEPQIRNHPQKMK